MTTSIDERVNEAVRLARLADDQDIAQEWLFTYALDRRLGVKLTKDQLAHELDCYRLVNGEVRWRI